MPDSVAQRGDERERVLAAAAEFADGGLAERMRLDAAARVVVTARRLLGVAPREAATGASAAPVLRVARAWDPAALTAAEHVEHLAPAELDAFLAAAPRWAANLRDATRADTRRAA
ncbi:hypothetical protein [Falsiroseomonas sp. HW251]|uniref:hypothetical protein n=1 Tax=Falsiroseomonas sp. HW251 TaxID=3390998 RepID=UPI003D31D19E